MPIMKGRGEQTKSIRLLGSTGMKTCCEGVRGGGCEGVRVCVCVCVCVCGSDS